MHDYKSFAACVHLTESTQSNRTQTGIVISSSKCKN